MNVSVLDTVKVFPSATVIVADVAGAVIATLLILLAVITPAEKFPLASLATTLLAVFALVASTAKVPLVVIVPPVK